MTGQQPIILPREALEQIDQICWSFEEKCRRGKFPVIEEELGDSCDEFRDQLLRELLQLEIYYRVRCGQVVSSELYSARFPAHREFVDQQIANVIRDRPQDSVADASTMVEAPGTRVSGGRDPGTKVESRHVTTTADGEQLSEERTQVGRFVVRRELGQGAFGQVLLAFDPQLEREVALKVPRAEVVATEEMRDRFRNEALAAAALDHPHIVQVYEAGRAGSICYIAAAYCPGITLADWIHQRTEPVPARMASELIVKLCDAVEHAHQRGVIHRDLKPGNILLTKHNSDTAASAEIDLDNPRIADFGLARYEPGGSDGAAPASDLTRTSAILGTPSYLSPEQAVGRSKHVGPTADVYALGAMLYELLTGRPPFIGDSALDVLEQVRSREPVAPRHLRPKLPRDLETICLKCLQKDSRARYPTAQLLADDLKRFLSGQTISARPVGAPVRLLRWCRRRPAIASLAVALLLVVAGSLAGLALLLAEARAHLAEANENFDLARDAVDELYTAAVDDPLLQQPRMQPVKKMLLLPALDYYRKLIAKRRGNPALREELANHYYRVARIHELIGNGNDALAAYLECAEIRQQLVNSDPSNRTLRAECADSYYRVGRQYRYSGDSAAALDWLRKANVLQQALISEDPADSEHSFGLAQTQYNLAWVWRSKGESEHAIQSADQALVIAKQLIQDHPNEKRFQLAFGDSLQQQALNHYYTGNIQQAMACYQAAADVFEPLISGDGDHLITRRLCDSLNGIAGIQALRGDKPAAAATYDRIVRLRRDLVAWDPGVVRNRHALARELGNYGRILYATDSAEMARGLVDEAIEIMIDLTQADPSNVDYRSTLASASYYLGAMLKHSEPAEALESFSRVVELIDWLESEHAETVSNKRLKGTTLLDMARLYRSRSENSEARRLLMEATGVLEGIAEDVQGGFNLVLVQIELGELHFASDELTEAARWFRDANARAQQVFHKNPHTANAQLLKVAIGAEVQCHSAADRRQDRLAVLNNGVSLLNASLQKSPENHTMRGYLADLIHNQALALEDLDRKDQAIDSWRLGIAEYQRVLDAGENAGHREGLAASYAELARLYRELERLTESHEAANQIRQVAPDEPDQLFAAACQLALTAKALHTQDGRLSESARECAEAAWQSLSQAIEAGFADRQKLVDEPALAMLRDRQDFQQLLDRLAK